MKISRFGRRIAERSGISQLMEDLGNAMHSDRKVIMLGGGNPAHIPEAEAVFRTCMNHILDREGQFEKMMGDYDPAQGNRRFTQVLASFLQEQYGWPIGPENVALTMGSQSAFFALFNYFAGTCDDGIRRKILFPLTPEYIGYTPLGLEEGIFEARKPLIHELPDNLFKYFIDFDNLHITDRIGGMCVSRPTNPTANVLTDAEVQRLADLAQEHDIPLIIDGAYGLPFPGIVFSDAQPFWNKQTIVCLSLSKLGLPGTRTGIIVADRPVIELVTEMNANLSLAPASVGAVMAAELLESGRMMQLAQEVIQPFYATRMKRAVEIAQEELHDIDFRLHQPEGAFFLWLWLPGAPMDDMELYSRLKQKGVICVPGRYFFPGLDEPWPHKHQCLRINYVQDADAVREGLRCIAREVRSVG